MWTLESQPRSRTESPSPHRHPVFLQAAVATKPDIIFELSPSLSIPLRPAMVSKLSATKLVWISTFSPPPRAPPGLGVPWGFERRRTDLPGAVNVSSSLGAQAALSMALAAKLGAETRQHGIRLRYGSSFAAFFHEMHDLRHRSPTLYERFPAPKTSSRRKHGARLASSLVGALAKVRSCSIAGATAHRPSAACR